jgi:hypothetical protein
VAEENAERMYPRIASVTKNQKIKIWAHESERLYNENSEVFEQKNKKVN